ncbi:lysine-specific histone demethylase 1B-like [Centruroides sculpturatus]|uniref:lysine-specific histone demethylase 1B-like n=1 Tax=Centruroides sculpturatus TaxID=218467 RepID=UPI000C6D59DC|nr:lysine-specific histone demethylase 1B-like [Centruroides sculpturatus]
MPKSTKYKQEIQVKWDTKKRKSDVSNNLEQNISSSKRTSNRMIKRKSLDYDNKPQVQTKIHRRCEKSGCAATIPICFASATDRCAGNGYTSRWYHMSCGEHYCNECFDYFYRSHKDGYNSYITWKNLWSVNGKTESTLKAFMADQMLPYWVKCVLPDCQKWRQLSKDIELTSDLIQKFCCRMVNHNDKKDFEACSVPEDTRAADSIQPIWIAYLTHPPLLKNSPSAQYLQKYYYDGVGMSPTSIGFLKEQISDSSTENQNTDNQVLNNVIALWNLNPQEWLTMKKVTEHLICRGLARIRCLYEAERILKYFTRRGIVNFGIVIPPVDYKYFSIPPEENVIVIGAGISGIGAARHICNLGIQVQVLEGRDRIGGRIWDDKSLGVIVGKGAHIVTGVINNPLTVIAEQVGVKMRFINHEKCDLYDDNGAPTSVAIDQRVEFHFNAMLDAVAQWRKGQIHDINLYDKLLEMHNTFLEETALKFTDKEENLLQFHISNLEYACGSNLHFVSALHWDHNDVYPQFAGDHTILQCGYMTLLERLINGLNISFKKTIKKIDYSEDNVKITTEEGEKFTASKVLVTIPLAVLQKEQIEFVPPLPQKKTWALRNLGAGLIEKIVLQFPVRFWDKKIQDADFFGHIPTSAEKRGLFSVFYDLSPQNKTLDGNCHVLMSYVSGDMVSYISDKSDSEIMEMCMEILRSVFNEENVPDPTAWFVTNWRNDPYSHMAYSYICTGGSGDAYDFLAEELDEKLYFAGKNQKALSLDNVQEVMIMQLPVLHVRHFSDDDEVKDAVMDFFNPLISGEFFQKGNFALVSFWGKVFRKEW